MMGNLQQNKVHRQSVLATIIIDSIDESNYLITSRFEKAISLILHYGILEKLVTYTVFFNINLSEKTT